LRDWSAQREKDTDSQDQTKSLTVQRLQGT
jgi:hypothetical protein